jgi:hypothetical protein
MREEELSPEPTRSEARWTAQDLRAYLLALSHNSKDRSFCLEQKKFPREIALSPFWHETFDQMRALSALNQREYWSMIGTTDRRDKVLILARSVAGEASSVPSQTKAVALSEAERQGVTHWIGEVHTHAARLIEKWLGYQDSFSIGDLYGLLYSPWAPAAKFLVGPSQNLAAFRSQQSEIAPSYLNSERFKKYWSRHFWQRLAVGDYTGVASEIGERYHLVLYKGRPGRPLLRFFP